jgi:mannose-1-phosphate guanylyltransferase
MASMAVGWSDLGSWTQLVAAIGGSGSGRVVPPGEAVHAGDTDLVIERSSGRLTVSTGPRDILAMNPVALLAGAVPAREPVDALVARVAEWEDRP